MRITQYFARHFQAFLSSLSQFSRAPFTSLMTCLIIGIALALPCALLVALKNFEVFNSHLQQTIQLTLYLKKDVKHPQVNELMTTLEKQFQIANAKIISPSEGLKELQEEAGLTGSFYELQNNPLPWTIVIQPNKNQELESLAQQIQKLPSVDSVQLDALWVKRLAYFMTLAHRTLYVLATFLAIAVLIIVNHSIRAATQQNQKEIQLIKLIGGTDAFIRRPFLYAGILYGLLGGIIAWEIVDILLRFLTHPLQQLIDLYNNKFQLVGLNSYNTFVLLGLSILLGFLGSWFASSRQLKSTLAL